VTLTIRNNKHCSVTVPKIAVHIEVTVTIRNTVDFSVTVTIRS